MDDGLGLEVAEDPRDEGIILQIANVARDGLAGLGLPGSDAVGQRSDGNE